MLRRVFPYIRPYKGLAALTLLSAMLATAMELIPPWLIKLAIDEGIAKKQGRWLILLLGILVAVYLGKALFNWGRIRLNNFLEQNVIFDIRNSVFAAVLGLSVSYFDDRSTGEILSRVNSDVETMERILIDGLEHLVIAGLTLVGITVMLFVLEWRLALVALLPIPFLTAFVLFFTQQLQRTYKTVRQQMSNLMGFLQDSLSGIRETIVFNRQTDAAGRFSQCNRDVCEANLEVARLWSLYSPCMAFVASSGTLLIVGFGSFLAARDQLTVGELVAFLSYAALFYTPINQIHAVNHMFQHAVTAAQRVFELLDTPPHVTEPQTPVSLPPRLFGQITLQDVWFQYTPDRPVLKGIELDIAPGERVALVGATGSGKSTTVALLLRLYDPQKGSIEIDHYNIKEIPLKMLRDQFGLVRQEPFLFNGTVRENIAYGNPHACFADLQAAAEAACANLFIQQLPERYDTEIGERGVKLSVGQKQRLAIARAFLKNPPIIILDEGTSSIDSETEGSIQEGLRNLFANRTTLIIAHRLSSLRHVDRILVLEGGKIVESGNHETLLRLHGVYAAIFETQRIK